MLDVGNLLGSLVGQSESNVRAALKLTDAMAPCVLYADEKEKALAGPFRRPANDRHILAYLKTVLAKLGLEETNHKFWHSFCTIAVLAGVDFFTLRRWVGHIDEEALKIYVHIADEEAQVTMRQWPSVARSPGVPPNPPGGGRPSAKFQQSHGGQT